MNVFILFTLFYTNTFCNNESDDIVNIKNHYLKISELIAQCNNSEECGLYQNKVKVNSKNGSWRAVGNYNKNITFWYNDDPNMTDEYSDNRAGVLQKITIEEWSGTEKFNYEFLFEKGELVFYYLISNIEYRYYFKETVLIRYMENSEILKNDKGNELTIEKIKKEGENLQQIFLLCHE